MTILNMSLPDDRRKEFLTWAAKPQLELLNEVHEYIPAFRATISPHDSASLVADWQWRNAAVEAAAKGTCGCRQPYSIILANEPSA